MTASREEREAFTEAAMAERAANGAYLALLKQEGDGDATEADVQTAADTLGKAQDRLDAAYRALSARGGKERTTPTPPA